MRHAASFRSGSMRSRPGLGKAWHRPEKPVNKIADLRPNKSKTM